MKKNLLAILVAFMLITSISLVVSADPGGDPGDYPPGIRPTSIIFYDPCEADPPIVDDDVDPTPGP